MKSVLKFVLKHIYPNARCFSCLAERGPKVGGCPSIVGALERILTPSGGANAEGMKCGRPAASLLYKRQVCEGTGVQGSEMAF